MELLVLGDKWKDHATVGQGGFYIEVSQPCEYYNPDSGEWEMCDGYVPLKTFSSAVMETAEEARLDLQDFINTFAGNTLISTRGIKVYENQEKGQARAWFDCLILKGIWDFDAEMNIVPVTWN